MAKALRRFYEPLALLKALDPVQGERLYEAPFEACDSSTGLGINGRRTVLKLLCEMCDYDKGGETVTAIALENHPAGPVYWVASNEDVQKHIEPFLTQTLTLLQTAPQHGVPVNELRTALFQKFTIFNMSRLRKTLKLARASNESALRCVSDLKNKTKELQCKRPQLTSAATSALMSLELITRG